jgi:phosphatidylglycerophosphatase A
MKLRQPVWPRSWPTGTVLALATLGPVGRGLPAPGTWGAAIGTLFFAFACRGRYPGDAANLLLSALCACLAVGLCGEAELRLGRQDPGEVILDEFVAMPLCFLGWPALSAVLPAWAVLLAGFGFFRLFDILKPLGIARVQTLPGGWGVVLDDSVAALAACATLHLILWCWVMAAPLLKA